MAAQRIPLTIFRWVTTAADFSLTTVEKARAGHASGVELGQMPLPTVSPSYLFTDSRRYRHCLAHCQEAVESVCDPRRCELAPGI